MANPIRLRILEILDAGESSVGAISEAVGVTVGTVSRHLRLMRDSNVVATRKEGQVVYYRVRHHKIVECCRLVREVLIEDLTDYGRIASDYAATAPKPRSTR